MWESADVRECILYCLDRWWQRKSNYCIGRSLLDIGPSLSCHLSPSLNS